MKIKLIALVGILMLTLSQRALAHVFLQPLFSVSPMLLLVKDSCPGEVEVTTTDGKFVKCVARNIATFPPPKKYGDYSPCPHTAKGPPPKGGYKKKVAMNTNCAR